MVNVPSFVPGWSKMSALQCLVAMPVVM